MKSRNLILFTGFCIFLGVILPLRAGATDLIRKTEHADQISKIITLSHRSREVSGACIAVLEALKKATKDSSKAEYFVSANSAQAVLNEAIQFPGTPLATSDAIESFLEMDDMPTGHRAQELRASLLSLSDCHAVEFYGLLTRLINPRTQRLLSSEDRLRARNLIVRYIRREATEDAEPPIQTELMTKLLHRSVQGNIVEVSPEGKAALETILWRLRQFTAENSPLLDERDCRGRDLDTCLLTALSAKFEQAEEIRYDLEDLIDSESDQGYLLPDAGPALGAPLALRIAHGRLL